MNQQDFDRIDVHFNDEGIVISERNVEGRDHHMPTNWRGGFSLRQAIIIAQRLLALAEPRLPHE